MQVMIQSHREVSEAEIRFVTQVIRKHLSRFADRLRLVQLRISETKGIGGSAHMECVAWIFPYGAKAVAARAMSGRFEATVASSVRQARDRIQRLYSNVRQKAMTV